MNIFEPKFVDRELELKALTELSRKGSPLVEFIYGPEGCGKTRLLKEFTKKFNDLATNGVIVYVDALEERRLEEALLLSPRITKIKDTLETIAETTIGPIGKLLAQEVLTILDRIAEKYSLRDKHVVIIVDDIVRAIGIDNLERYIKWLLENIYKISNKYKPKSVLMIATTSEGYSLDRVSRHRWASISLIWNLDKKAFIELTRQLNPPNEEVVERAWRTTGGNPRTLIEIAIKYEWDIDSWLKSVMESLAPIAREIVAKDLTSELLKIIENPDNVWHEASREMEELYRLLIDKNLLIYKWRTTIDNRRVPKDLDLGIGEYYAWQIPVHRRALEQLLKAQ